MPSSTAKINKKIGDSVDRKQHSIIYLINKFKSLQYKQNKMSARIQFATEQSKLAIMVKLENRLKQYCHKNVYPIKNTTPMLTNNFNSIGYRIVTLLGTAMSGLGGYLGSNNLLNLISLLSPQSTLLINIMLGAINAFIFFTIEGFLIKDAFGIQDKQNDNNNILELYKAQIAITKRINKTLTHAVFVNKVNHQEYQHYVELAVIFNQEIKHKRDHFGLYQEPIPTTMLRYIITGFGAVLAVSNGYFIMKALLVVIPLINMPNIALLTGIAGIATLAVFSTIRTRGIYRRLNPDLPLFTTVQQKLAKFAVKTAEDFKLVCQSINQTENINHKDTNKVKTFTKFQLKTHVNAIKIPVSTFRPAR